MIEINILYLISHIYVMFNFINLYVAIHDISVLIIKVAVLMHKHVHSCLHLNIVNKMLFDIHFIIYVYSYFIYNLYVLTMNLLPKPLSPALHSHTMTALIFSMSTIIHLLYCFAIICILDNWPSSYIFNMHDLYMFGDIYF